ncbi:MAG: cytochrome b [Alphaproteobacteria bacterium]|nr:cytochrome b [Alphaproteobacteria bacterium]
MALDGSARRYGTVAMLLHWTIALLILSLIAVGLYMSGLPNSDPQKFELYQLHKSFGLTVLALSVVRVVWRLMHPVLPLPAGMKTWERVLAYATHIAFYVLMFAIPLFGWAMVSASPLQIPTFYFGLFQVPHLPVAPEGGDRDLAGAFAELHEILALSTLAVLALHIAGALKHHFIERDDVLIRMLPFTKV